MAMTVTATQGGSVANGMVLRVFVLTQAAATQNGATVSVSEAATTSFTNSITTTQTGSRVYGASSHSNRASTAAALTTVVDDIADATNNERYVTYKATSLTGTPGPTTLGFTVAAADTGPNVMAEIKTAGTLTEDGSAPAAVSTTSATTVVTASFTPPAGALLVALVGSDGGAAVTTMTVSGGGLTWTELVKNNPSGIDYAGVWIARVPAASGAGRFTGRHAAAIPPGPGPGADGRPARLQRRESAAGVAGRGVHEPPRLGQAATATAQEQSVGAAGPAWWPRPGRRPCGPVHPPPPSRSAAETTAAGFPARSPAAARPACLHPAACHPACSAPADARVHHGAHPGGAAAGHPAPVRRPPCTAPAVAGPCPRIPAGPARRPGAAWQCGRIRSAVAAHPSPTTPRPDLRPLFVRRRRGPAAATGGVHRPAATARPAAAACQGLHPARPVCPARCPVRPVAVTTPPGAAHPAWQGFHPGAHVSPGRRRAGWHVHRPQSPATAGQGTAACFHPGPCGRPGAARGPAGHRVDHPPVPRPLAPRPRLGAHPTGHPHHLSAAHRLAAVRHCHQPRMGWHCDHRCLWRCRDNHRCRWDRNL